MVNTTFCAVSVHLTKAPFTPSASTDLAALIAAEADFGGYAVQSAAAGGQLIYQDPVSGLWVVELIPAAGTFRFDTVGTTNLPQTVYGYFVTDSTNATLMGCGLLDTPVPLTAAGQGQDLPPQLFRFALNSPF